MRKISKRKLWFIAEAVVGVLILVTLFFIFRWDSRNDNLTKGLTRVAGYNHIEEGDAACLALTPACGYCPGQVIDKECYVDKKTLKPHELQQLDFEE